MYEPWSYTFKTCNIKELTEMQVRKNNEKWVVLVGWHTQFHTYESRVFDLCTIWKHASFDTSFSVCSVCTPAHPTFSSEEDVALEQSRVLPAGGNSSSLISFTHILCHIHLLLYSVSLRLFFLLCLYFYFSLLIPKTHTPSLFFILSFRWLIYLLSPDHSSLFLCPFFSSSPIFFFSLIYSPIFFAVFIVSWIIFCPK